MADQKSWNESYADGNAWRRVTDAEVVALAAHLPAVAYGARALDVGCGTGKYAAALHVLGYDVDGIDWAPAAIKHARGLEQPGLRFHVADLADPGLAPGYGLVTARLVYPVVDDRAALLEAVDQLLAPDGVFVVTAPRPDILPASRRHVGLSGEHLGELADWAAVLHVVGHEELRIALCTRST
ncbi:class I SAM-dependent methyltransferase [Streptomyces sp. NPDC050418]|uniref:class I SAM-dependent methyltransferase n=1 Tax=Streptomyces sp. NPDC050418 TaxID=3365612 RepID=UPI0037A84E08